MGQFHNSYRYTVNPISHIDPDGLLDYEATLVDQTINVHIDDAFGEAKVNQYKAQIDASLGILNTMDMDKETFLALRNLEAISVTKQFKLFGLIPLTLNPQWNDKSGMFYWEESARFNIASAYLESGVRPNASAMAILHDAGHNWMHITGGNPRSERYPILLQQRNYQNLGLDQREIQWYESQVKQGWKY